MTHRRTLGRLTLFLALLAAAVAVPTGAGAQDEPSRPYIVVLKRGQNTNAVANEHAAAHRAKVSYRYNRVLNGYAATIPDSEVDDVRRDGRVDYVEPDVEMTGDTQSIPWGIDRIDAEQSSQVSGDGTGEVLTVDVYVLDTGSTHTDLNVRHHQNFVGDGKNFDCNGHGTHVAGIAAAEDNTAAVVGVAPGAPVTAVKVLNCKGTAPTSRVIAGVDWVTNDRLTRVGRAPAAVANMSLSGTPSAAMDQAVVNSVAAGITYSLAAGNKSGDACNYSPARAGAGTNNGIITVGAINRRDGVPSFSNRGACVDLYAPGVNILSLYKGNSTDNISGTSMAAPHVGGTAALFLVTNPTAAPANVEQDLKAHAHIVGNKAVPMVYAGDY